MPACMCARGVTVRVTDKRVACADDVRRLQCYQTAQRLGHELACERSSAPGMLWLCEVCLTPMGASLML